jgi:hypothetical protein
MGQSVEVVEQQQVVRVELKLEAERAAIEVQKLGRVCFVGSVEQSPQVFVFLLERHRQNSNLLYGNPFLQPSDQLKVS